VGLRDTHTQVNTKRVTTGHSILLKSQKNTEIFKVLCPHNQSTDWVCPCWS